MAFLLHLYSLQQLLILVTLLLNILHMTNRINVCDVLSLTAQLILDFWGITNTNIWELKKCKNSVLADDGYLRNADTVSKPP